MMRIRLSPVPPSGLTCALAMGCACVCVWAFLGLNARAMAAAAAVFAVAIPPVYVLAKKKWHALSETERQEALARHR